MMARMTAWSRGLAARTAVVMLACLMLVQVGGLTIHALDRRDLQRLAQAHDVALQAIGLFRTLALADPERRRDMVRNLDAADAAISLDAGPPVRDVADPPPALLRQLRAEMQLLPMPQALRPRETVFLGGPAQGFLTIGLRLADGDWLNLSVKLPPPRPWDSPAFLAAFLLMTAAGAALTVWTVRRLVAPLATLAIAAERLGRDVNAPGLPEDGPTEIAAASAAFNTMAARIRRFVADRTFLLAAIGHDLRTPITRLRLRAEFMEDEEQRRRMLGDLDQLEAMVAATLAFGRDVAEGEAASAVDLPGLVRTVLDEAADAAPEAAAALRYDGPEHLAVQMRPVAMKRAVSNLVQNALNYGGNATVTLLRPRGEAEPLTLLIEDDGPGLPPDELERVFHPFYRLESSRNRETGGVGLGLPIVRNILRAHGGDVTLTNRPTGGARATVSLPV